MNRFALLATASLLCLLMVKPTWSQDPPRRGQGQGLGRGMGQGQGMGQGRRVRQGRGMGRGRGMAQGNQRHGHDDRHDADREVFQFLLQNHQKIKRTVKELPDGVETLTESTDSDVADKIKEHVEWMEYRIENTNPIRMRDPLFAELFKHTDKIKMLHEDTENGVRVTETSDDPYVAKLIKAHAKVVSGFVERGFAEAMKNHSVPGRDVELKTTPTYPVIAGQGPVVQLPSAAQQPRNGSKIVVDLTRGGDPGKVNAGLQKVAKYVNLYAGGGAEPANVTIAVVFHGDATLAVLNSDAYAAKFSTDGNPNLALLRQLHQADVELYVCGQSLLSLGEKPEDVTVFIETAVSALTSMVNLQSDGFAYVPLLK